METWIALLRGVNVGGNKKLPMADFRNLLSGLGFTNVATYIQSGNAVFQAAGRASDIGKRIETAVSERFGFHSDTFVLSLDRLDKALAANPFPLAADDPKTLHLFFLEQPNQDLDGGAMRALLLPGQDFALSNGVFYLYSPDGLSKCPLADKLGRFLSGSMTGRNLRSCLKIAELAGRV